MKLFCTRSEPLEKPIKVIWPGEKIPQDRTIVRNRLLKLNLSLYIIMVVVALIGIGIAIGLIYFNFRYGHRKIIQQSHPSCNNLMLVGIILCLLAIIPLGIDGRVVSPTLFPVACGMTSWLLTLGLHFKKGILNSYWVIFVPKTSLINSGTNIKWL